MSFKRETIEKYSLGYALLYFWARFVFKHYFKTTYINKDKIPKKDPFILAPNHQNALMDPLAVLYAKNWQPVFLARADIFSKKFIASLLTFIKILPVYRIRDGFSSLQKNDDIFEKTVDVIQSRNPLVILPEGNHGDLKKLRSLKKGICRIAFQTEEANDFKLDIKIVPVGLDYSNYQKVGSELLVNFGDPICVSDYYADFKESPQKAYTILKDRIGEEIKKVMIHIEDEENHDTYINLIEVCRSAMLKKLNLKPEAHNNFKADQATVSHIDLIKETINFEDVVKNTAQYFKNIKDLKLRNWVFNNEKYGLFGLFIQFIWLLVTLPVFLTGLIINLIPYMLPRLASKNIKDTQFISSVNYGVAMLGSFPIFYTTAFVLSLIFLPVWWYSFAVILFMYLTGFYAFNYSKWYKKWKAKLKFTWKNKSKLVVETKALRAEILKEVKL